MADEKKLIKVAESESESKAEVEPAVAPEAGDALVVNAENAPEIVTNGKGILKLRKPVEIDGKMAGSVYFDLSSLSGVKYRNIIRKVEKEIRRAIDSPADDIDVQTELFAAAADIPVAIIKSQFSLKDLNMACTVAHYFLIA